MRVGLLLSVSVFGLACSEHVCVAPGGACVVGHLLPYDAGPGGATQDASASESDAEPADAAVLDSDAAESQATDAARDSDADAAQRSDAAAGSACESDSQDSGIPGVSIHIAGARCSFLFGQGGTFRYRVALDQTLSYHVPQETGCGGCRAFGSGLQSLVHATVSGAGVSYCPDCDVGCCAPADEASYDVSAQSVEGILEWPGRSWSGPSDTGQALGAFFSAGDYFVTISVSTPDGKTASGRLPIRVEAP
jgi:hypothetical protein